jgi:hypothetical protein
VQVCVIQHLQQLSKAPAAAAAHITGGTRAGTGADACASAIEEYH